MNLIDNELRKRRRVAKEGEGEGDPPPRPTLSKEMQLAMIESLEDAQRGAIPTTPISRGGPGWRRMQDAWKDMRAAKLEHPPDTISLEHVRLFISPRFKLVSHMQWPAVHEVFKAFNLGSSMDARKNNLLLMFYRERQSLSEFAPTERWKIKLLGHGEDKGADEIVFQSREIRPGYPGTRRNVDGTTSFSDKSGIDRDDEKWGLIYGRVNFIVGHTAYNDAIADVLQTFSSIFFNDIMRDGRPAIQALGWRNKNVLIRGQFLPISLVTLEIAVSYIPVGGWSDKTETAERSLRIKVQKRSYTTKSGDPDPHIRDLAHRAFSMAKSAIKDKGVGAPVHIRLGIAWPNQVLLRLMDSRKPEELMIPGDKRLSDLYAAFAHVSEPVVSELVNIPEWGYTGSMYLPTLPRPRPISGFLLMPAPWFFYYYTKRFPGHTFPFAKGLFSFKTSGVTMMTLDSDNIRAHQPFEMIFLPDDLDIRSLEDLAMLQRKDIRERATAPLVEVELL